MYGGVGPNGNTPVAGYNTSSGGMYGNYSNGASNMVPMSNMFYDPASKVNVAGGVQGASDSAIRTANAFQDELPSVQGDKFFEADIRYIPEDIPYNSYFGGAINTQKSIYETYQKRGLNSNSGRLLMHEYGHYLQSKYYGEVWYNLAVVPTSVFNINTMEPYLYDRTWTEVQANTMSYYYFNYPANWDFTLYPVNFNYISEELKSKLYYHK